MATAAVSLNTALHPLQYIYQDLNTHGGEQGASWCSKAWLINSMSTCGIIYGVEHVLSPPNGRTQSQFGLLSAASTTTTE